MMNDMSLKARIRNIATEKKISAQAVLQNYLMRRFLLRLSKTDYKDKFVVKGGMLISSIVGVEHRATMDLDATLRNLPLTEETIRQAFETICSIEIDDGITFRLDSIGPIRDDDEYGGYRAGFSAIYGKINAPMSMDVSTGDIITPGARKYSFSDMFDENTCFELWAYSLETILAEKIETILSRGIENTRPRDFYDVYMLSAYDYDPSVFKEAFAATAKHRGSYEKIMDYPEILHTILINPIMQNRWKAYSKQMQYAYGVSFEDTISAVVKIMN